MGKKNVHKLSPEPAASIFIAGIASHENDYRISWALNDTLGWKLAKTENHLSLNKRLNVTQEFSKYSFHTNESSPSFTLLSNRCDNGFLLEQYKNIDFVLIIEDPAGHYNFSEFTAQLKNVPFISAVFPFEPKNLKNMDRLK